MVTTGNIYQSKSNKVVLLTLSISVDVDVIDFSIGLHKGIPSPLKGHSKPYMLLQEEVLWRIHGACQFKGHDARR